MLSHSLSVVIFRLALIIFMVTGCVLAMRAEQGSEFSDSDIGQFHLAASNGDIIKVRNWLERGMPVDAESGSLLDTSRWTALCHAAHNGRETVVQELISHGANVAWRREQTIVHIAAGSGYYAIIRALNQAGANLEEHAGYGGETPLIIAAALGYEQTVRELIALGARIEAEDEHGRTALLAAAEEGRTATVSFLLSKGANPHNSSNKLSALELASTGARDGVVKMLLSHRLKPTNTELGKALSLAAGYGKLSTVELLLDAGADVNSTVEMPPLHLAASKGRVAIVRALLARRVDINFGFQADPRAPERRTTALHIAAGCGHLQVTGLLLSAGASPLILDEHGASPLDSAIRNGDEKMITLLLPFASNNAQVVACARIGGVEWLEKLLRLGADPNAKDGDRITALYHAARRGDLEMIRALHRHGATLEARSGGYRDTALMAAVAEDQAAAAELLLDLGADLEAINDSKQTALFAAPARRDIAILKLLVDRGASPRRFDDDGSSVLTHAAGSGRENKVRFLLDHDMVADERDHNGRTALHCAVRYGSSEHVDLIRFLLERGADPNVTDHEGHTPWSDAMDIKVPDVAAILERAGARTSNRH